MPDSTIEDLLNFFEKLGDKKHKSGDLLEGAKGVSLLAAATPKGAEIDALSKLNPKTPVYFSVLLGDEKRINELAGKVKALGEPLYLPMHFFSDMVLRYMQITPSTGKSEINRAEAVLDTLKGPPLVSIPFEGGRPSPQQLPEPLFDNRPTEKKSRWPGRD